MFNEKGRSPVLVVEAASNIQLLHPASKPYQSVIQKTMEREINKCHSKVTCTRTPRATNELFK